MGCSPVQAGKAADPPQVCLRPLELGKAKAEAMGLTTELPLPWLGLDICWRKETEEM